MNNDNPSVYMSRHRQPRLQTKETFTSDFAKDLLLGKTKASVVFIESETDPTPTPVRDLLSSSEEA